MKVALNGMFWSQPTTGSGQYLRALLTALKRRAPENEYVVLAPKQQRDQSSSSFILHPSSFVDNLAKLWFEQIAFANACRRERAELAHVPYFASPYFPPTRTVVTIHDLIPLLLPAYRGSPLVRAYTRLVAASARHADAVIADSECSQRDIVQHLGIGAARVHVVYLAADARYRPVDDTAVRARYALPEKYLLYLGGFDQRKSVRVIIEAFARLSEFHARGYRLVLAGVRLGEDSAFFPNPQRIARQVGLPDSAIQYIGWIDEDDKPALYSGATAFLFPSLYEGFGLPPLEAMACGAPVISSNASSLPEVVGDAAIQVDPQDMSAWADAIYAVLTDDARRAALRERGIAQSKKFSWDRAAKETLAVYESVTR
jgi:glycosyltransferase involved in cell wall biosynthesis